MEQATLVVKGRARAKVNLRLEVLGRRPDGYHEISTVLHTIELADELVVSLRLPPPRALSRETAPAEPVLGQPAAVAIEIICQPDLGIEPQSNLAYKAAAGMLAAWRAAGGRLAAGASIGLELRKRIPLAAGLGGGSSDAAAVLRGLDALLGWRERQPGSSWPQTMLDRGFSPEYRSGRVNLHVLAERLGSDIPFLLAGGAALGVGRGERLVPIDSRLRAPVLLAAPPLAVRAGEAYRWWDEAAAAVVGDGGERPGGAAAADPRRGWPGRRLDDVASLADGLVHNDLTANVMGRLPLVGRLIEAMRAAGAAAAEMTGSGPVVFGVFTGPAAAATATAELKAAFPGVRFIQSRLDPEPAAAPQVAAGEGTP